MSQITAKNYTPYCLPGLTPLTLTNGKKVPLSTIELRITTKALNCGLYFRAPSRELALISGAGISGLAASFELLARGFKVIIAEKRGDFSRFNVINLNVETQHFLKKFGLLKEFKKHVAARIQTHRCVHIGEKGQRELSSSDVRKLQLGNVSFEPENFGQLFNEDGIYSVKIKDLQTFLAKKVLEAGAHLVGNVEVEVLEHASTGRVSKVRIVGKESLSEPMTLQPDLFFVAEGAHSTTADQLGMGTSEVENGCTGENWIFGNVAYSGNKTFVVSIVDTSKKTLEIANVIFNAKIHEINVAVTSSKDQSQQHIRNRILEVAQQAFHLEDIQGPPQFIAAVERPVTVKNKKRTLFSKSNVFLIGDTAGCSSPLAGLGGTLGLTLIPRTIKQLLDDREKQPIQMHQNFERFTDAYTSRWIEKSMAVKNFCLDKFNSEKGVSR